MMRTFLKSLALALPLMAGTVSAQDTYPVKPITIILPFGAGSGTDAIVRTFSEKLSRNLKQPVVIDYKVGASGQIAAEAVARATPDGYTIMVGTNSTHSANPYLFKSLRYDPIKDFVPIGRITLNPLALLVRADSPFKTAADLVRFGRENPGKLNFGFGNTGGQVAGAMIQNIGKFKAVGVPYKSTPQVFTDMMGGLIDFTFVDFAASSALIDGGKIRPLAVSTAKRLPVQPNVPTMRETSGLEEFELVSWIGFIAPAGTPRAIATRLNNELRTVLEDPEVKDRLEGRMGSIVEVTTLDEFASFMRAQDAIWKRRIAEAGITPE